MNETYHTNHMHKLLGCIYDMACEAIKNGSKAEAKTCRELFKPLDLPVEVLKSYEANLQGGVVSLFIQTKARVEQTCQWLDQASDEEIAKIQKSQAEFTQWKYYK